VKKFYVIVLLVMVTCLGCQWQLRPSDSESEKPMMEIERFDCVESMYLTTGDFAVLQQMKTEYPIQTRTLIEDVLCLGPVDTLDINTKFLIFFQDSVLQALIKDVQKTFADMDDINRQLGDAFGRLSKMIPEIEIPQVYSQISSLDESIIVGHKLLGVSLDKYLGEDYPLYQRFGYTERQRKMMTRKYIVPDCLSFYLLSLYHKEDMDTASSEHRSVHMGRIQYVVNSALSQKFFNDDYVTLAEQYMKHHPQTTIDELLSMVD
jgi:hypothetical protein